MTLYLYILTGHEDAYLGVFKRLDDALAYVKKDYSGLRDHTVGTRPWAQGTNLHVTIDGEDTDWYDIRLEEVS